MCPCNHNQIHFKNIFTERRPEPSLHPNRGHVINRVGALMADCNWRFERIIMRVGSLLLSSRPPRWIVVLVILSRINVWVTSFRSPITLRLVLTCIEFGDGQRFSISVSTETVDNASSSTAPQYGRASESGLTWMSQQRLG